MPEFNVEVMAAAMQDPEIEEAAIRFANGDAAGAEAVLLDLVAESGSRREDVHTWLTLFDLYRCMGEPTKFDDAAFGFAALFGRSAPQWAVATEEASAPAPIAVAPAAVSTGLFNWTCPSTVGTQSVAALKATMDRHAPPWRIDWRHLKTVEPAALPALLDVLKRWGETPAQLKFLGAERLLQALTERSPTDDRSVDPEWWEARLALLRVLGEMDEFELVALNYCVTYEVSPPAWEEPKSSYRALAEDGQTLPPPSDADAEAPSVPPPTFGLTQPYAGTPGAIEPGVVKATLAGEYLGTAEEALKPLVAAREATSFEVNCRQLLRVDFGAAGDLLGERPHLREVNSAADAARGTRGRSDRVVIETLPELFRRAQWLWAPLSTSKSRRRTGAWDMNRGVLPRCSSAACTVNGCSTYMSPGTPVAYCTGQSALTRLEVEVRGVGWIDGRVAWTAEGRIGIAFERAITGTPREIWRANAATEPPRL